MADVTKLASSSSSFDDSRGSDGGGHSRPVHPSYQGSGQSVHPSRSLRIWPATPQRSTGRKHGTSASEPFDRWFRYPAGFASDYAGYLLSRLGLDEGQTVVDCFAGSGVTGTAARRAGLAFAGIEAHPMIAELAALKLKTSVTPAQLRASMLAVVQAAGGTPTTCSQHSDEVLACAGWTQTNSASANTAAADLEALATTRPGQTDEKYGLLDRSFSTVMLRDLFTLREAVRTEPDPLLQQYLKWALLACLRDVAQVKVGWPYQRPGVARRPPFNDLMKRFTQRVDEMADDLASIDDDGLKRRVVTGDSRTQQAWAAAISVLGDGCVSSPPYLNNFDYADATRLEAYFWGEATTWAELVSHIRSGMLTATTQQSSTGESDRSLQALKGSAIAAQVQTLTSALKDQRQQRARGKEYDRVVPAYFSALDLVLSNLGANLAAGAPVAWLIGDSAPYGVHIDTPALIGQLATDHGFVVEADVVLRERGRRWATAKNRHSTPLSERLLVLRRD